MDLNLTRIFIKVVQNGSFSRAALQLKLPKSTVSKAILKLEQESGTKLLLRTTRSLNLTAAGRAFFDSALGPLQTLEDAQKSLQGSDSIAQGQVRITAPEDLGQAIIAPIIAGLSLKHPKINFELHYTDEIMDLVKDGFDIAVRIGRPAESNFKIRPVGEVRLIIVSSPKYLEGKKIREPKDLENLDCISLSMSGLSQRWPLQSNGKKVTVLTNSRISSNQMSTILQLANSGAGVALVPKYFCEPDLKEGKLKQVLPLWQCPGLQVSIISPQGGHSTARLKLTIDALYEKLTRVLR